MTPRSDPEVIFRGTLNIRMVKMHSIMRLRRIENANYCSLSRSFAYFAGKKAKW